MLKEIGEVEGQKIGEGYNRVKWVGIIQVRRMWKSNSVEVED